MSLDLWISLGVLVIVSTITFITSYRKQPVIGILAAGLIILAFLFFHKQGLDAIGFAAPKSWLATVLWSLGLGIGLSFLVKLVIEPIVEKSTDQPHDPMTSEKVRGNWKRLLLLLASAWVLASFLEEAIFRGFLITGIEKIITGKGVFASIALLLSAIVFGLAHWHQGKNGIVTSAILGLILGDIFIWSGYNLWMPILTRGVLDTRGLLFTYFNVDTRLRRLLRKEKTNERRQRPTEKNR